MGVAMQSDSDELANDKLLNELRALNLDLQVPTPADFGIDKATFMAMTTTMAEQALASGSPGNNPRIPTIDEMVELYCALWE
jgi:alcohol dehydrogenase class IV